MTAPPIYEAAATGAANVGYVFHVSGQPWAIATSQAVADLIDADTVDYSTREAIFGVAEDGDGNVICHTIAETPIFVGLEQPGKISWKLDEAKGAITGGSWKAVVSDKELGHTWLHCGSTAADGTVRRGLPGVHHMAMPMVDDTCAFVELAEDFLAGDTTLVVENRSTGSIWEDAVEDDATSAGFRVAWMNGEALILDNNVTGTDPELNVTVLWRGAFRSRDQNHTTEESGANPLIYDVAPSIVGQTCYLHAVYMNDAGTSLLSDPVEIRQGKVSPDIQTKNGMTTIRVNTIFDNLDETFTAKGFKNGILGKYVFTRDETGTASNGSTNGVEYKFEMPHLVIKEWDSGDSKYYNRNLWLCDRLSSVVFDTLEEVMNAVQAEIDACWEAYDEQNSGDSLAGVPTADNNKINLNYHYTWDKQHCILIQDDSDGTHISWISGICAWMFNMGPIINDIADAVEQLANYPDPFCFYGVFTSGNGDSGETTITTPHPWMTCAIEGGTTPTSNVQWLGTYDDPAARRAWQATYLYMWQWDYSADGLEEWQMGSGSYAGGGKKETSFSLLSNYLYLFTGISLGPSSPPALSVGDTITLGKKNDWHVDSNNAAAPRYCQATISAIAADGFYTRLTLSPTLSKITGYPTPFRYGAGIFYIPALESYAKNGQFSSDPDVRALNPWKIQTSYALTGDTLSDIFKAILGDSTGGSTANAYCRKNNIIGFTNEDDLVSIIDWDSLDDESAGAKENLGIVYYLSLDSSFNILDALWNECLLHGISPTLEWDDTKKIFLIRFRKFGPVNLSQAYFGGRTLTESDLQKDTGVTESHSNAWLANEIQLKMNYEVDKHLVDFSIPYESSFIPKKDGERGVVKIESMISHIPGLENMDDDQKESLIENFRNNLLHFAQPQWSNQCNGTARLIYKLALGRECLVTDRAASEPITHAPGLSEKPAYVTAIDFDLGGKMQYNVTYRIATKGTYGWAPAVKVAANNSTKMGDHTIDCTAVAHTFTPTTGRTDCSYFDCLNYNLSYGTYVDKACSCADYKVIAFETGDITPTLIGGSGELTITDVVPGSNTFTLVDGSGADTHYNNWDVTKDHYIIFDEYDEVEDCQKYWVCACDDNSTLGTDADVGHRWI